MDIKLVLQYSFAFLLPGLACAFIAKVAGALHEVRMEAGAIGLVAVVVIIWIILMALTKKLP